MTNISRKKRNMPDGMKVVNPVMTTVRGDSVVSSSLSWGLGQKDVSVREPMLP